GEREVVDGELPSAAAAARDKGHPEDAHLSEALLCGPDETVSGIEPTAGVVRHTREDRDFVAALGQRVREIVDAKGLGPEVLGQDQDLQYIGSPAGGRVDSSRLCGPPASAERGGGGAGVDGADPDEGPGGGARAMRTTPQIPVVTASFNAGDFIDQCVRSVAEQDLPNVEHVVIDGGSTDGTVEIVERYAHRLSYWHSKADRGVGHAYNLGLE